MSWSWRDLHVAVTGASSGIGEAIARELADAGARLTLIARREDRLRALAAELKGAHVEVRNLGDPSHAAAWIASAEAALGPIDVLVNNAGAELIGATDELPADDGEALLRINLNSPLRMMHAVLPGMLKRGRGAIVNIASAAALVPARGYFWYAASKAGLAAASIALHDELEGSGVRVVTAYPGPIRTDMATRVESEFEQTFWLRHAPYGDTATLARMVRRAVEREQSRVIYPRLFALARWLPPLAAWLGSKTAPAPRRAKALPPASESSTKRD